MSSDGGGQRFDAYSGTKSWETGNRYGKPGVLRDYRAQAQADGIRFGRSWLI